jgi:hypothetical protein
VKPSFVRRVGIIVLLSLVSIALHELGHYTVYKFANIPVHITLQSVRPIAPVSGPVAVLGLAAGPVFSLITAVACLLIARHRPSFLWVTAAFTNATLRLFPCALDLARTAGITTARLPKVESGTEVCGEYGPWRLVHSAGTGVCTR